MRLLFFLVFSFLSTGFISIQAQNNSVISDENLEKLDVYQDTLAILAYAVVNDSLPEHRFGTCKALIKTLVKALKTEHSFHYTFDRLQSVSIQYPADSTFRVFTWQLYVDVDDYRYFGAIQMNTPELQLFPLIDRSFEVEDVENEILSADKWYGSVYYNLKEVDSSAGKYYLLFGFDGYSFFKKRKIIDVLTFSDGKPIFGAPVFVSKNLPNTPPSKNRFLLEYSAEASVRLNYDELLEKIVFDHLIELNGPHGEGPTRYPDGSYMAYQQEGDYWLLVPKLFDQVSEEPPRPLPVLGKEKKDIFGNR